MVWKYGKRWVYSITYDEGCQALLSHALPVHRQYGIPGHVCVVSSEVGVPRMVKGSTFEGWQILSREELNALVEEDGWGLSCHSMTHGATTDENAQYEVVEARRILEEKTGLPVNLYCVPGCNDNYPAALKVAEAGGYHGIMTIYDDINRPDVDLMRLCRVPLHTEYPPPFYSRFDPYKRLHQAMDAGGWVIDYCHCPLPDEPSHPWKDCTLQELEERFKTVLRLGGDDVWLAEPNEVVEYIMEQRASA